MSVYSTPEPNDVVLLERNSKSSCKIHLFGATLISWICDGDEFIFVSSKATFDNKSAIRGGIPIVFPNFGPWKQGPQHGFCRITRWNVEQSPKKSGNGDVTAILSLDDDDSTRKMWDNHKFKLLYTVTLSSDSLKMTFRVENKGSDTMSFTCLLHTYIRVPDITSTTVSNLKGLSYIDKMKESKDVVEERQLLTIDAPIDSIYRNTPNEHTIFPVSGGKSLELEKENLPDTVIWNPWKEKAMQMTDLGEDYAYMICVEAGHVTDSVQLEVNGIFSASQTLKIV